MISRRKDRRTPYDSEALHDASDGPSRIGALDAEPLDPLRALPDASEGPSMKGENPGPPDSKIALPISSDGPPSKSCLLLAPL